MIEELTRKLRNKVLSNGTITDAVGTTGMYLRRAPQNANYPYLTFFPIDEAAIHLHQASSGTPIIEDTVYQIDLWHTNTIGLATLHQEVKNSLDGVSLSLSTIRQVGLIRQNASPLMIDHDDEAGDVFHQFVEYRAYVC